MIEEQQAVNDGGGVKARKERVQRSLAIILVSLAALFCLAVIAASVVVAFALVRFPPTPKASALEVEAKMRDIAAEGELWPGFDPTAYPLAIYDGDKTYLFRHPDPLPEGFEPLDSEKDACAFSGKWEEMRMNTAVHLDDYWIATVMMEEAPEYLTDRYARTSLHELFHVYQWECEELWPLQWATREFYDYPLNDADLQLCKWLEDEALARALEATDKDIKMTWAAEAVAQRRNGYNRLSIDTIEAELAEEMIEGFADYVGDGHSTLASVIGRLRAGWPLEKSVFSRCYYEGLAYALLLDDLAPGWKANRTIEEWTWHDELLARAVKDAVSPVEPFTTAELDKRRWEARESVSRGIVERNERMTSFFQLEGPCVEVCSTIEAMRVKITSSMYAKRVNGGGYICDAWMKLITDDMELESKAYNLLVIPVGINPIVSGARRIVVRGLPEHLEVKMEDGVLTITAEDFTATFSHADFTITGDTIKVTLNGDELEVESKLKDAA